MPLRLLIMNNYATPFARPLYLMAKPVGSVCNLNCAYCYYLEKSNLYRDENKKRVFTMSDEMLETFIRKYLEAQAMPQALFTWHGGEPLMRPVGFYEKALALQRKYGKGMLVENCIQTNGTLLTDQWCEFFKQNNWLVGISIDGPREFHDKYRRTRTGGPSFSRVMNGINLLNKHGVEWNAMAVVNDQNAGHPLEFYQFFKDIGCRYIQFTPIVERILPHSDGRHLASATDTGREIPVADYSVRPGQWGEFLCTIFDEWVRHDVGSTFIQLFDATLANWAGQEPGVCSLGRSCGHAAVMEHNGDVYSCDHFVFPEYKLGNLRSQSLVEMIAGERQTSFGLSKRNTLPRQCLECRFTDICNGECPKNRFLTTSDGEYGLNYLCSGYHRFFRHAAPFMEFMKSEYEAGRPPSNVMAAAGKIASER